MRLQEIGPIILSRTRKSYLADDLPTVALVGDTEGSSEKLPDSADTWFRTWRHGTSSPAWFVSYHDLLWTLEY